MPNFAWLYTSSSAVGVLIYNQRRSHKGFNNKGNIIVNLGYIKEAICKLGDHLGHRCDVPGENVEKGN